MDRPLNYPGALARVEDLLLMGQKAMTAVGGLARATMGTGSWVEGFTCVPTAPASLAVSLTQGQVFQPANLESSAVSMLSQDTHSIMKQGIMLDAVSLTLVTPTTPGYAQSVLVEVQYADFDGDQILLNYYNPANPTTPLQGPGGNGQQQATTRKGIVSVQTKYGVAATSGTQVAPTPDAGWAPLFLVTLAYGQTSITAGNIIQHAAAPFFAAQLGQLPSYTLGQIVANARRRALTNLNLYVRSDGNDGNDGSANTTGNAFLTIQAAVNAVARIDLNGFSATVNVGVGTFAPFSSQIAFGGVVSIVGILGSTVISGVADCVVAQYGARFSLTNLGFTSSSGNGLTAQFSGQIIINTGCTFGSCVGGHISSLNSGEIDIYAAYTITAGAAYHLSSNYKGIIAKLVGSTFAVTVTGSPAFTAFAYCDNGSLIHFLNGSFSGAASGVRYQIGAGSVINTGGGGASFFPGSTAGSSTGVYE